MDWLLIGAGLAGLFAGAEFLVRGSVNLATRLRLSPLVIGLTVVGFGTSAPELIVSVDAALRDAPAIALGNVVGSNIANVLLILGLTASVWPIREAGLHLRRDLMVMVAAAVAVMPAMLLDSIGRPYGLCLLVGLALYLALVTRHRSPGVNGPGAAAPAPGVLVAALTVVAGLAALVVGARFLVDGSVALARNAGVSEAFIGISIVAVGTSLPELVTSLVAASRGRPAIALGNVVGSNVFNLLGILGATAVVAPVPVAQRFAHLDVPVMVAASIALAATAWKTPAIGRGAGVAMLVAYAGYLYLSLG